MFANCENLVSDLRTASRMQNSAIQTMMFNTNTGVLQNGVYSSFLTFIDVLS